jgi:nitroreductase
MKEIAAPIADQSQDLYSEKSHAGSAALEVLLSRQSAEVLEEPGPSPDELALIVDAALRAPDHGRLRPWRFVLVQGDARNALGAVLAEAAKARDPQLPAALIERQRMMPMRAPLVIAFSGDRKFTGVDP